MRYVMSDLHGEYDLFVALMKKIGFSPSDELYVCGDIIEKGKDGIKLAKLILSMPNAHPIMGNHEDAFIQYYNFLMRECDGDYDRVLATLRQDINGGVGDGHLLDWDIVDKIEALPYYIETEDFICIHAGLSLTKEGEIPPLSTVSTEELIANRRFKERDIIPKSSKCVFFGHTATSAICDEDKIIAHRRKKAGYGDIRDYAKIHLDTCTMISGVLGCFCIDTCLAHYVKRGVPDYDSEVFCI